MHTELLIAAWGALLLRVHISVAGHLKTRQYNTS